MYVSDLSKIPVDDIIHCFLLAFDGYFVKMPQESEYYKTRWRESKVDFSLSYGMFDDGKLVGFILHVIDERNGVLTAYNAGTGVIPEYRGKRIIKSIYEFALKDLVKHQIKKSTLEVIVANEKAIKAYQGMGFNVCKTFKCFNGEYRITPSYNYEIKEIPLETVNWNQLPHQNQYSWDNQGASLLHGDFKFYYVLNDGIPESYFVLKPNTNYIAQCDVLDFTNHSWERLFLAIQSFTDSIKINNVDSRQTHKLEFFNHIGLNHVVDQYEMELDFRIQS